MIHRTSLICVQYKMKILYSKELTAHARCDKNSSILMKSEIRISLEFNSRTNFISVSNTVERIVLGKNKTLARFRRNCI